MRDIQKNVKLIISPHPDDEVLGCASILDKKTFVYYCGIDEKFVPPDPTHRIGMDKRLIEIEKVSKFFKFKYKVNYESYVNNYHIQHFIVKIEEIINKQKPDIIFIPHPGYNQDHKVIFSASYIALRPHDKNFFVRKVLVYEAIHDMWSYERFEANCYKWLDINKKIQGYKLHESQVRSFRSPEQMKALARIRGWESGLDYAEAFQILRWVL